MENKIEWMETLLNEHVSSEEEEASDSEDIEEEDTSCNEEDFETEEEEGSEEEGTFYIFKEDNPYKLAEKDEDNGVYQVIGNEIIMIARAEGVCCICSEVSKILYIDNSYGGNIPAQICNFCIQKVLGN